MLIFLEVLKTCHGSEVCICCHVLTKCRLKLFVYIKFFALGALQSTWFAITRKILRLDILTVKSRLTLFRALIFSSLMEKNLNIIIFFSCYGCWLAPTLGFFVTISSILLLNLWFYAFDGFVGNDGLGL